MIPVTKDALSDAKVASPSPFPPVARSGDEPAEGGRLAVGGARGATSSGSTPWLARETCPPLLKQSAPAGGQGLAFPSGLGILSTHSALIRATRQRQ